MQCRCSYDVHAVCHGQLVPSWPGRVRARWFLLRPDATNLNLSAVRLPQARFHHGCAGETGERRGRESLTMNGVASPIGPESCVSHREVWGEALTGVLVGQVLSHVTKTVRDADAFCGAEGSTVRRVIASATPVPRGLRPWHVNETFCSGTGRSHGWPSEEGLSASGRLEGRSR